VWEVDVLRGDTGVGDSFGPELDEFLDGAFQLATHVLRRVLATEAPVEQCAVSEVLSRV